MTRLLVVLFLLAVVVAILVGIYLIGTVTTT